MGDAVNKQAFRKRIDWSESQSCWFYFFAGFLVCLPPLSYFGVSQVDLVVKNPSANAGDIGDTGLIPGSGRYPGEGNGNPLQYSRLGNSMDRGSLRAIVHGVAKSQTWLSTQALSYFRKASFSWSTSMTSSFVSF